MILRVLFLNPLKLNKIYNKPVENNDIIATNKIKDILHISVLINEPYVIWLQ